MKIILTQEHDQSEFACPDHGCNLVLEDQDSAYRQFLYLCPVVDCDNEEWVGPSDNEIYLREQGRL